MPLVRDLVPEPVLVALHDLKRKLEPRKPKKKAGRAAKE